MLQLLKGMTTSDPSASATEAISQLSLSLEDCSRGRRIAVLGGSFDPITTGHLKVACEIIHTRKADEVWIVPCGARPDKPSLRTPYMHRLLMCHLAVNTTFGSTFPIRVCDIEGPEPQALATYHLMQRLKLEYPSKDFLFVLGADLLSEIRSWTAPGVMDAGERLWSEGSFLLMERPGYDIPKDLPANFTILTGGENTSIVTEDTSSSEIRRRIQPPERQVTQFAEAERTYLQEGNWTMVDGLLNPAVLAHVIRYRLYITHPPPAAAPEGRRVAVS